MFYYINPDYSALADFIHTLPQGGYSVDKTFCHDRNVVELITGPDRRQYVLKRFKRPNVVNRVVYKWFRKDKAQRAYDNALMLLDAGVATPRPVAYMRRPRHGLYHTGWYLSEYMARPTIDQVYRSLKADDAALDDLMTQFFRFTLGLYAKHIIDKDYNPGNILVERVGEQYSFALVDINRMRRGTATLRDEMTAMSQMSPTPELIARWLPLYARLRGASEDELHRLLDAGNRHIARKQERKRRLRALLHHNR